MNPHVACCKCENPPPEADVCLDDTMTVVWTVTGLAGDCAQFNGQWPLVFSGFTGLPVSAGPWNFACASVDPCLVNFTDGVVSWWHAYAVSGTPNVIAVFRQIDPDGCLCAFSGDWQLHNPGVCTFDPTKNYGAGGSANLRVIP